MHLGGFWRFSRDVDSWALIWDSCVQPTDTAIPGGMVLGIRGSDLGYALTTYDLTQTVSLCVGDVSSGLAMTVYIIG